MNIQNDDKRSLPKDSSKSKPIDVSATTQKGWADLCFSVTTADIRAPKAPATGSHHHAQPETTSATAALELEASRSPSSTPAPSEGPTSIDPAPLPRSGLLRSLLGVPGKWFTAIKGTIANALPFGTGPWLKELEQNLRDTLATTGVLSPGEMSKVYIKLTNSHLLLIKDIDKYNSASATEIAEMVKSGEVIEESRLKARSAWTATAIAGMGTVAFSIGTLYLSWHAAPFLALGAVTPVICAGALVTTGCSWLLTKRHTDMAKHFENLDGRLTDNWTVCSRTARMYWKAVTDFPAKTGRVNLFDGEKTLQKYVLSNLNAVFTKIRLDPSYLNSDTKTDITTAINNAKANWGGLKDGYADYDLVHKAAGYVAGLTCLWAAVHHFPEILRFGLSILG